MKIGHKGSVKELQGFRPTSPSIQRTSRPSSANISSRRAGPKSFVDHKKQRDTHLETIKEAKSSNFEQTLELKEPKNKIWKKDLVPNMDFKNSNRQTKLLHPNKSKAKPEMGNPVLKGNPSYVSRLERPSSKYQKSEVVNRLPKVLTFSVQEPALSPTNNEIPNIPIQRPRIRPQTSSKKQPSFRTKDSLYSMEISKISKTKPQGTLRKDLENYPSFKEHREGQGQPPRSSFPRPVNLNNNRQIGSSSAFSGANLNLSQAVVFQPSFSSVRTHSFPQDMLNLLYGVCFRVRPGKEGMGSQPVGINICEGNNGRLVKDLLLQKPGVKEELVPPKCFFQWSQTYHKNLVASLVRTLPRINYKDLDSKEEFSGCELLDANLLTRQIIDLKLFSVEDPRYVKELVKTNIKIGQVGFALSECINLVNHLRGIKYLGSKTLLTQVLSKYLKNKKIDFETVMPKTFIIKLPTFESDIRTLYKTKMEDDGFSIPVIIKPGENANRGIGIAMGYNFEETSQKVLSLLRNRKSTHSVLVQYYIPSPLLYQKRKFDIRCYALVIKLSSRTLFFWYKDGYARTSSFEYSISDKQNLMVHLTNEAVQVKGKTYSSDSSNFGNLEPGNKVYFDDLARAFDKDKIFTSCNKTFIGDILPQFKVILDLSRNKPRRPSKQQLARSTENLPRLVSNY